MKYKKGAASFYIIAFSTLILLTIAMSFAAIIISQVTRTSNSDLSQSAYDSAMAGVEDAKLAYYNYQDCLADASNVAAAAEITDISKITSVGCPEIIYLVERSDSCDTVGLVLGRINPQQSREVPIQESSSSDASNVANNMQQAYTCVKMATLLDSYEASLTTTSPARVVNAKFDGVAADDIESVIISWYSDMDGVDHGSIMKSLISGSSGNYKLTLSQYTSTNKATPPVISLGLVQTAEEFRFSDFDYTTGGRTDRGMVYFVPTNDRNVAAKADAATYKGIYNGEENVLGESGFLDSNDKTVKKLPYAVYCEAGGKYYCSAIVKIPAAIGGARSDDNFTFVVSSPYAQPTEFSLQFKCKDGVDCGTVVVPGDEGEETTIARTTAALVGVQVGVDSTGRANDLYRRVQVRMDISGGGTGGSSSMSSVLGPLELSGDNTGSGGSSTTTGAALEKIEPVICEWESDFGGPTC